MEPADVLDLRARRHAALGDPTRLAIIDELTVSDRSPVELRRQLQLESNLLAHHLHTLERVGLVERHPSSGDGRRRYVHLRAEALEGLSPGRRVQPGPALFVCRANSARSQLAAVVWSDLTGQPAASAGTHPADRVHPGAVSAAWRVGLVLTGARPEAFAIGGGLPDIVVTVCDQAHEELDSEGNWLHWSVPDPVPSGTAAAFDATVAELRGRIGMLGEPTVAS